MTSDNEDDDLEALRMAALATLKQKVRPIEKVIGGGISSRPKNSPPWSDVPASIDFQEFADPIPDATQFLPYEAAVTSAPQHEIKTWPSSNRNGDMHPGHRFPRFGFGSEKTFGPRFPRQTFGARGGPRYDQGNRRLRRDCLPQQSRGLISRNPPGHPTNPQTQGSTANLIVIQPQTSEDPHSQSASMNNSNRIAAVNPPSKNDSVDQTKSKLLLPQDKYSSSPGAGTSTNNSQDTESQADVKVTDKFSRYDKSDSEDDDLSDVDDIANEIDKVLQDDFLGPEATLEVEEKETVKETEEESGTELDDEEVVEELDALEVSGESNSESLDLDTLASRDPADLDALASREPAGDFEDLDCLVDQEPESSFHIDKVLSINSKQGKNCKEEIYCDEIGKNHNCSNSPHSVSCDKSDINDKGQIPNVCDKSDTDNTKRFPKDADVSQSGKPSERKLSVSPPRHNSFSRGRNSPPPRRYDSYYSNSLSRRSRSPLYPANRRSKSPRKSPRRSPYGRLPSRRSMSPQRRSPGGFGGSRRFASPTRNYFVERGRLNSSRRSLSPRNRIRDDRRDTGSARVYDTSRLGENEPTKPHSVHRDRSRLRERDRLDRQSGPVDSIKTEKSDLKELDIKHKISPTEKRKASQEKEITNLDSLTPEEQAKIEARRKKFDNTAEVKLADASKTVSLKSIKTREKKQKKKDDKEDNSLSKVEKKQSGGISLKRLRKKQESKKKEEQASSKDSPKAVRLADLEDDSEDSDGTRAWKKEGAGSLNSGVRLFSSRMSQKAPSHHRDTVKAIKNNVSSRKRVDEHLKKTSGRERLNRQQKLPNNWSSDDEDDSIKVAHLSSRVVPSKPPDKLRIQVQVLPKETSKKKSKSVPEYSEAHFTAAKRPRETSLNSDTDDDEAISVKKHKKKKEKKKKHSKTSAKSSTASLLDEMDVLETSKLPPKTSVLERLGKKVDLNSSERKKKKKSKKSHSADGSRTDLDLHIRKMKAKNEEIIRRQREIQLDKEKYG